MGNNRPKSHVLQLFQFISLLLSLSTVLSACTHQIKPQTGLIKQDASLAELISLYRKGLKQPATLKALMKVDADFGDRGQHAFQAIWRSQENQTHIRGLTLFGGTLFDLKVDLDSFSLSVPSQKEYLEADLDHFKKVAGKQIPFSSVDLLRWVERGGRPDIQFPRKAMLEKGPDLFFLTLFSIKNDVAMLEEKVWIEREAFRVTRVELFEPSGYRSGVIEFNDYREVSGRIFPFSVTGTSDGKVITLEFREVSFPSKQAEKKQ